MLEPAWAEAMLLLCVKGVCVKKRIGVIGGSGLYEIEGLNVLERVTLETPFGEPSDTFIIGELEGREVVFLPRHGVGHRLSPTEINYRANIWGMKALGVEWILSVSAVGSYKEELKPTDMVVVDQFIDRTRNRENTFFGNGLVAHVMFAHPICNEMAGSVMQAARDAGLEERVHSGGTYVCMEGPAFSTKAESKWFKSMGMDVIGMTNITEARLAREAEICFVTLAMVTDYDCWIDDDPEAVVNVEMVLENLKCNVENAKRMIRHTLLNIDVSERRCECATALQNAIITSPNAIPQATRETMDLLVGKYLK